MRIWKATRARWFEATSGCAGPSLAMAAWSSSTGMQKAIASVLDDFSVTTPITRPAESKTGPPELPGLTAMFNWR